jgi:tetratricopeptide (TPR) repeat protein
MEKLEKIIKYLDGDIVDEEKLQLENKIANSKEMQNAVALINEVDQLIQDKELTNFANTLHKINDQFVSENKNETNNEVKNIRAFKYLSKPILFAATITLIIGISSLIFFTHSPSNKSLFEKYYTKYDAYSITRSGANETDDLTVAIQLYDLGHYKNAIDKFAAILKNDQRNIVALFFIGVSYMETQAYEKAIIKLKLVVQQKDTAFLEHAQWYLALCYLKTNQLSQAKLLIKEIGISESYYRALAIDLSRKFK